MHTLTIDGTTHEVSDEVSQLIILISRERDDLKENCDAKQAQIDSLMLEYCPEEMTLEQLREWRASQEAAD